MRHAGTIIVRAFVFCFALAAGPARAQSYPPQETSAVGLIIGFLISALIVGGIIGLIVWGARRDERDAVARTQELKREREGRRRGKARKSGPRPAAAASVPDGPDALEELAERHRQTYDSGTYDSGGYSDSGFEGGGGSSGGGGADDRY